MKKKSFLVDLILFTVLFLLTSLIYYLFNKNEINKSGDYGFLIYVSLPGASSVIFVPILQKLFRKNE